MLAMVVCGLSSLGCGMAPVAPSEARPAPGPVGDIAAPWTPSLVGRGTSRTVGQVRQMVQCGPTMYAVGRFTRIRQGSAIYARRNAFSFSATTGRLTTWSPRVNGEVNSVALSPNCSTAYLGGSFSRVRGRRVHNIAAVNAVTGALVTRFSARTNDRVNTLVAARHRLFVGGNFTSFNGSPAHRYFTAVRLATGRDHGYVDLHISGHYVYKDARGRASAPNATQVFNTALSPGRARLLVMGVFTSVGGQARRQIFMADLRRRHLVLDPWYSREFRRNCAVKEPFWLRGAGWSPDGSTVYTATTGYKPANGPGSRTSEPRSGLCDSAAAFPSMPRLVRHRWINYTGCDSLYSVAADRSAAYFGGHERWANNRAGCDAPGQGAVDAPGMVGLSPRNGAIVANPTRGRGLGADALLVTSAGLWISSDNAFGANICGRTPSGASAHGHAGICFLPYR
jgi:hypothetical protein